MLPPISCIPPPFQKTVTRSNVTVFCYIPPRPRIPIRFPFAQHPRRGSRRDRGQG